MNIELEHISIQQQIDNAFKEKDLETLRELALSGWSLLEQNEKHHTACMVSLAKTMEMDIKVFKEEPRFKWVSLELGNVMRKLKETNNVADN